MKTPMLTRSSVRFWRHLSAALAALVLLSWLIGGTVFALMAWYIAVM